MKKEQKQHYEAPEIKVHVMMKPQRVIATSGGESYNEDNGPEGDGNEY